MGFHLFPFRTEKLSPLTPMVLRLSRGRVGSRLFKVRSIGSDLFLCAGVSSSPAVPVPFRGTFSLCSHPSAHARFHTGFFPTSVRIRSGAICRGRRDVLMPRFPLLLHPASGRGGIVSEPSFSSVECFAKGAYADFAMQDAFRTAGWNVTDLFPPPAP